MVGLRLNDARAIAINWRWPCEKLIPPTETCVSSRTVAFPSTSVAEVEAEAETAVEPPSLAGVDVPLGGRELRCH